MKETETIRDEVKAIAIKAKETSRHLASSPQV